MYIYICVYIYIYICFPCTSAQHAALQNFLKDKYAQFFVKAKEHFENKGSFSKSAPF